jgi:hypothetical protein
VVSRIIVVSVTVVVSTGTGVTVVVSTFVTIVVSTVPAAVSVRATGSFEIGMRFDELAVLAGHFAVAFAPARHVVRALSRVLCAITEDDITIIAKATATPVAHRPLFRMFMIPPLLRQLLIVRRRTPSSNAHRWAGDVPFDVPRPDASSGPKRPRRRARPDWTAFAFAVIGCWQQGRRREAV